MSPEELKQLIETDPEAENTFARFMARRSLERQQSPEKAAYGWLYGHNLSPQQIEARNYQDDPYVQKYKNYKEKMFPNIKKSIGNK